MQAPGWPGAPDHAACTSQVLGLEQCATILDSSNISFHLILQMRQNAKHIYLDKEPDQKSPGLL